MIKCIYTGVAWAELAAVIIVLLFASIWSWAILKLMQEGSAITTVGIRSQFCALVISAQALDAF